MGKRFHLAVAIVVLAMVLGLVLAACGGATQGGTSPGAGSDSTPALDGQALVQERCTQCHDLTRVERAKKTQQEWQATVERMIEHGAQLTPAEQEAVVKYLAETYK
jgi:hypothetical protein